MTKRLKVEKALKDLKMMVQKKDLVKADNHADIIKDHLEFMYRFNARRMVGYIGGGIIAGLTIVFKVTSKAEIDSEYFKGSLNEGFAVALIFAFAPDIFNLIREYIGSKQK